LAALAERHASCLSGDMAQPIVAGDRAPSRQTASAAAPRRETLAALLWRELAGAARSLLHSPSFSWPALLSVAFGTGAALALFGVFSALTLRPLPFREPERLVVVGFPGASGWSGPDVLSMSHPLVARFREYRSIFEAVTAVRGLGTRFQVEGRPVLMPWGQRVPLDFFDTLGAQAEQGRTFSALVAGADARDVVVLRRTFWLTQLGGAPVLGQRVFVNEQPKTVIGILSDEQALPTFGDIWYPVDLAEDVRPDSFYFSATARLVPGLSLALAQQRLMALTADLEVRTPAGERVEVRLTPLRETLVQAEQSWLELMLAAVVSFLLLSCANLAALLGTRSSERQPERAVRAALGANRRLLAAQGLLEAFLLVMLASVAGLGLAYWGIDLANQQYGDALGNTPARIDARVLAGLLLLILLCTFAGALAPLLATRRLQPMAALAAAGRASEGRAAIRFRDWLVGLQVAASVVLLISAGLLLRSLQATLAIDLGFRSAQVVTAQMMLRVPPHDGTLPSFMAQREEGRRQVQALLDGVRSLPGVLQATVSGDLPFDYIDEQLTMELEPGARQQRLAVRIHNVGPDHFETLGIRLIAGRSFTPEDQQAWPPQGRALISQNLARDGLGVENPVGHQLRVAIEGAEKAPWIEIIGMVESTREVSLTDPPPPSLYFPFFAYPTRAVNQGNFGAVVAVHGSDALDMSGAELSARIGEVLPEAPVTRARPLSEWVADSFARRTALSKVLSALALAAVALSVIGLFGITRYTVALRSREIAIRRALGASRGSIRRLILVETGRVVGAGLLAGWIGSWLARDLLASFLFGVTALDAFTYAGVSLGVVLATSAAALLATRSATSIAPAEALLRR
jgi:putative ABC transport system permease protein